MALNTHPQRTLSDREYNSNYLRKRNLIARPSSDGDSLSDSINDSSRLTKTAKTKHLPTAKSATKVFINYNNMFVDAAPAKAKQKSHYRSATNQNYTPRVNDREDNVSLAFSDDSHSYEQTRLLGGANRTQQEVDKLILSPSQCKFPAVGLGYFEPKKQVNLVHLQLSDSHTNMKREYHNPPLPHVGKSKTRGTQSLYRESSAQTLPYLPGVLNEAEELETLEVFKLPTILPGNGPPGLYEVEVLERARKRWAFAKALKENFRKQLQEAREQAKLQQNHHVIEAFEWEHWLEREEYIQECQMLRLEILIRMFDKRERQMYNASQTRIQKSCETIEARRQAALKKNEIVHARALRRLEIQHAKQPRVWRKEHISQELGDPSSEFYAPKMRNGVNPNRRHFQASRKEFNMRMDDLEKTAVKMDYKHLKCPFAKLKEWSKPKEVVQEVEQNFCSEGNLKKLYESMRTLRESSIKQKTAPLCLNAKMTKKDDSKEQKTVEIQIEEEVKVIQIEQSSTLLYELNKEKEEAEHKKSMEELRRQKTAEHQRMKMLHKEMRCEEMESLINTYEGNIIGWLMRFLSEEMCRLKEQRKLQFFTMVTKRERWHREAAEAGLRQKENHIRDEYEQLYNECDQTNIEIAEKFFRDIMETDIEEYAEQQAEDHVKSLARKIDKEIIAWCETFHDIQNPLSYDNIRYALRNIVMPDKEKIVNRLERNACIDHIINDVILGNVYQLLETYDVSFAIANDFVDRLIDNDMYLNSPECSSECSCECTGFCTCSRSRHEAMAIIRKVIRRAVPGRRWRTSQERIAFENVSDLLDDVFDRVIPKNSIIEVDMQTPEKIDNQPGHSDLKDPEYDIKYSDHSDKSYSEKSCKMRQLGPLPPIFKGVITKSLQYTEDLLLTDPDKLSVDRVLVHKDDYTLPQPRYQPTTVHRIPSTYDISSVWDFTKTPAYNQTSSDELMVEEEEMTAESMDEMKSRIEDWALEISSSHRGFNDEYEEEEEERHSEGVRKDAEEEQEEEQENDIIIEDRKPYSVVHFVETPIEHIIESKPTEELAAEENDDDDDDNVGGIMEVEFSYDPSLNYTIPFPSSHDLVTAHDSLQSLTENIDITDNIIKTEEKVIKTEETVIEMEQKITETEEKITETEEKVIETAVTVIETEEKIIEIEATVNETEEKVIEGEQL